MSVFHEFLHKLMPKNWQQGNHFFLLDSQYVEFAFRPTVSYAPGAMVTYSGKFFQRNHITAAYRPGVLPTDTTYWIPANPGRDLGDFASLSALSAAHPDPAAGSIATVEDEDAFYKWDKDAGQWLPISGSGVRELLVSFNADLDSVSAPLLFKGLISNIFIVLPASLTGFAFRAKLSGGSSTSLADISALQYWISNQVVADDTLWVLEILVNYAPAQRGEATLIMQYEKVRTL
jgi:hypothetical protein